MNGIENDFDLVSVGVSVEEYYAGGGGAADLTDSVRSLRPLHNLFNSTVRSPASLSDASTPLRKLKGQHHSPSLSSEKVVAVVAVAESPLSRKGKHLTESPQQRGGTAAAESSFRIKGKHLLESFERSGSAAAESPSSRAGKYLTESPQQHGGAAAAESPVKGGKHSRQSPKQDVTVVAAESPLSRGGKHSKASPKYGVAAVCAIPQMRLGWNDDEYVLRVSSPELPGVRIESHQKKHTPKWRAPHCTPGSIMGDLDTTIQVCARLVEVVEEFQQPSTTPPKKIGIPLDDFKGVLDRDVFKQLQRERRSQISVHAGYKAGYWSIHVFPE